MFDIGFSELLLVMVIGLVVLGPERFAGSGAYGGGMDQGVAFVGNVGSERTVAGIEAAGVAGQSQEGRNSRLAELDAGAEGFHG